ncbi:MAG: class I SAM-dependent methyltransferase [Candidatus Promineifilaceae bacterium]
MSDPDFEQLIAEAMAQDFSGWDFSWLQGRWCEEDPPWAYEEIVAWEIERSAALLDMGTGGGEFLASLAPLPPFTVATESYPPNIPIARSRLEPLGVRVVSFTNDNALPLQDNQFDLIINRHDSYSPAELYRLLKPGGRFLTQQVGSQDCIQLNDFLNAPPGTYSESWKLEDEIKAFRQAGFHVERAEEALLDSIFYDIGAVVFYLKIIEWQIPDFSPERYHERLLAMHRHIEETGAFKAKAHRFLLQARK